MVSFFPLSIMTSRFIHVVTNSRIYLFLLCFWLYIIFSFQLQLTYTVILLLLLYYYYTSFRRITQWSDIIFLSKWWPNKPFWHHTLLLEYYRLHSLCCTSHPCDYSVTTNSCLLTPSPFSPILPNLPSIWQPLVCSLYMSLFLFFF